jgi:Flagellar biosynthesis protein, FliO
VEITTANPPFSQGAKLTGLLPFPAKLVHTRLVQSKLMPAWRWPRVLPRPLVALHHQLENFWRALIVHTRRVPKSLIVSESAALGDRRLVSVVQFERQRFLIGCGPSTVTLLARLPDVRSGEANSTETGSEPGPSADGGSI